MSDILKQLLDKFTIGDGCWEWSAAKTTNGYGVVRIAGRTRPAHRVLYEYFVAPVPHDMEMDHLCRVRHCVRPSHLEPVPKSVNIARGESLPAQNARKTHCPRGHPFTPDNLSPYHRGWRRCKICHAQQEREYRAKRRVK